jgi:hypothetical protein
VSDETKVGRIVFGPNDPHRIGQGNAGGDHGAAPGLAALTMSAASGGHIQTELVYLRASNEALRKELAEADRRAGAAERHAELLEKDTAARGAWLTKAKAEWGVDDRVSFDVVWKKALAAREQLDRYRWREVETIAHPDNDRYVEVYTANWDGTAIGWWDVADSTWNDIHGRTINDVTHWREIGPLPELAPPKD